MRSPSFPDPTKLENHRLKINILKGRKWQLAQAKSDGSWDYGLDDNEFEALIVFISINEVLKSQEALGMTPLRKITGFIGDPKVPDNAFLDPMKWEFRTGKGSGMPAAFASESVSTRWSIATKSPVMPW